MNTLEPMCSQYEAIISAKALKAHFGIIVEEDMNFPSVRPSNTLPVLVGFPSMLEPAKWGFLLPQDGKADKPVFNAKAETVETSAFFKGHLKAGRCIAPFSAFREGKMRIVPEGGLSSFPALRKIDKDGLWHYTFLTTIPDDFMRPIHNRMPRILSQSEERAWLNPDTDMQEINHIIHSRPSVVLTAEKEADDFGPLFSQ